MKSLKTGLMLTLLLLAAVPARADPPDIVLKSGAGQDATVANCSGCHSLDYIQMNATFLTPDGWKAEVTKMRQAYGAPVEPAAADEIARYLAASYGAPPKQ